MATSSKPMEGFTKINGVDRLRRLRILRLDPTYALAVFAGQGRFDLSMLAGDCEVVTVSGDWLTNSIELMVWSSSFEIVPAMGEPPVMVMEFIAKTADIQAN